MDVARVAVATTKHPSWPGTSGESSTAADSTCLGSAAGGSSSHLVMSFPFFACLVNCFVLFCCVFVLRLELNKGRQNGGVVLEKTASSEGKGLRLGHLNKLK